MYHMHRPQKISVGIFFSQDTCSIFLKWSSYLCIHSSWLLGQLVAHPGPWCIGSALSHLPSTESLRSLFPQEVCCPHCLTSSSSHPSGFKCQLLQEALPAYPRAYGLSLPFAPMTLTCTSVSASVFSFFTVGIFENKSYLPNYICSFWGGCVFCLWCLAQCLAKNRPFMHFSWLLGD